MATMNSDLLITKTTVILDQPSDWQKWIFLRKDSAQRNDLWAYVNPNVATETVLKLEDEKPAKKEAGVFYGRGRTAGMVYDLEHLDEHEYRKYSAWYTSYQKELTKFEKKELALRQFNSEIATTISERRLHWIMNLDTPHARLRKLKNQLCPSTAERETQLLSQYLALRKMPKRANIESWLDSWEELLELMAAAEMAEVKGTRAQRDFLDSVQSTDDSWATSQRISMIAKQEEGESFLPAVDLVGRFRLYYRQTKPVASTLGTFAALGDPQEISQDTDKFRKINCLCGEKHRFIDCPYVNSAKRSSGWKADSDMKKKFDTIRSRGEGSRISAVLRSVEAKLAKQAQQSKPQIEPSRV
ncbi:C6 transcription factor (NirA) [Pyrenophora tritici-repentis]|nr:C6 transcription factor (NirA) [Pyrenophora tritici-repentis]